LSEIYNKFSPAGYGLIGFSFGVDKNKYQEFIKKNCLKLLNITDLKGGESEILQDMLLNCMKK
jgi:hypothetical protein